MGMLQWQCSPELSLTWILVLLQSGRELVHPAEHEQCVFMLFHQQGEKDSLLEHLFWCLCWLWPCLLCGQNYWMAPDCLGLGQFIESLRLEKTSKIMQSNHPPNTTMPTKPYPEVPHLHVFLKTSSFIRSFLTFLPQYSALSTAERWQRVIHG